MTKNAAENILRTTISTTMKVSNNLHGIKFYSMSGAEFEKKIFSGGKIEKTLCLRK